MTDSLVAAPPDILPTERQRSAIEAPLGPMLVLAGPGAGKTFCLIERIRYLIEHHGLRPERIVAVTFTNKAAGEIAHRLRNSLGLGADRVTRSTIHSLCVQLLREHGESIGIPRGFGIADEEYQVQALRRAGFHREGRWPLGYFSRHRIQGTPLDDWLGKLYQRYREVLDRRGLLDFDDLVAQTEVLLRTRPELATEIAARWDYVLVDEGQDLNLKQYDVLMALARVHHNIFIVGDDEQSIYSWTGADPAILSKFLNEYDREHKPILLDENRRNSRVIFDTARKLVAHNPSRHDKSALRSVRESTFAVEVKHFLDDSDEASWLVADLVRDRLEHDLAWGDFALLYRKHEIGDALEARLVEAGIPCQLAQGRAIADDPAVQYLVAALRVIDRPGDPVFEEQFAKVVLPRTLYDTLRTDADQNRTELLDWMRKFGRASGRRSEDGKKVNRCLYTLGNLPGMADRLEDLQGLIAEVLSQKVGEYRSILENNADVITDPVNWPTASELAVRLRPIRHGRARVWLPRIGGVELGLAGLLREAGLTTVEYLDPGAVPDPQDVVLGRDEPMPKPLDLFKALQLVTNEVSRAAFRDFVSVDVESSDLDVENCEVIELGAVRVRNGAVVEEFHRLVKPTGPLSPASSAIHGYKIEDLVNAPSFAAVWTDFRAFAADDLLIAHNGHGFDFPVLRRLAKGHPAGDDFPAYDTLPLARALQPGSRKLADLAHGFGIPTGREHHALDDARTLAHVFLQLEGLKQAFARKTGLVSGIDHLAVALALTDPAPETEEKTFLELGKLFALGRYSHALESYEAERSRPGSAGAPEIEQLIERLGGKTLMERLRRQKSADDRYPAAMIRLRRLLDGLTSGNLAEQLSQFLDRVTLSQTRGGPEIDPERVSLLTLHSTKGLEFSRVYIVGAEDTELPGSKPGREATRHDLEEGRRLLYVGMTRARDRLVLTRVERRNGNATLGMRYLEEMDLA